MNRAHPGESALLPATKKEKYWLLTLETQEAHDHHAQVEENVVSALIFYSPTPTGAYASFFLSQWTSADSVYRFGMYTRDNAACSGEKRWPIVVNFPSDSSENKWRWYFGRKHIWLDGMFQSPRPQPISLRGMYSPSQPPLDTLQIATYPAATALPPLDYKYMSSQGKQTRLGMARIIALENASILINSPGTKAVYWISFGTSRLPDNHLFMESKEDGTVDMLGSHYGHEEHGHFHTTPIQKVALSLDSDWESPHSHKTYGLGVDLQTEPSTLRLRPVIADQEIRAGRNSFWMGAIQALGEDGQALGVGNMYIFTR